mmetsp:Transcript_49141/g.145149  ORF Transcript_49141/g.145149 Transcript_49141/m.145149 type:complete len:209 (-) Transcript_49141:239-865(-)
MAVRRRRRPSSAPCHACHSLGGCCPMQPERARAPPEAHGCALVDGSSSGILLTDGPSLVRGEGGDEILLLDVGVWQLVEAEEQPQRQRALDQVLEVRVRHALAAVGHAHDGLAQQVRLLAVRRLVPHVDDDLSARARRVEVEAVVPPHRRARSRRRATPRPAARQLGDRDGDERLARRPVRTSWQVVGLEHAHAQVAWPVIELARGRL